MARNTHAAPPPPVELRELAVFLAVAEELHFGRAAERLQLNRSRASQIINLLEARIGGRLFDRTSRRVSLTPLGEQLASSVARPYRELHDVLLDAREAATGVAGTLRIGMYFTLSCGPHMPEIVSTFETRHSDCEVLFISTGFGRNYLDVLRAREVDMLATRLPLTEPDITVGPILSREERVVLVARGDPLAERDSISYEELADRVVSDVPGFPREMMNAFIPPVTASGRVLRRITNVDPEVVKMRIAVGEQVHPTVRSMLEHYSHPGITSVPIRDLQPSETALVWLTANRSPKIAAFVRAASDVLAHASLSNDSQAEQDRDRVRR